MNMLKESINSAKLININNYKFRVFDFGERGQHLSFNLIQEVTSKLLKKINKPINFDCILTPAPNGFLWASILSYNLKKELNILRLEPSYKKNEIKIKVKNNYQDKTFYLNNILQEKKVMLFDDVVSSGKTLEKILEILEKQNIQVVGIYTILVKGENYKKIERKYNIKINFLEAI